jgi:hypothetical protein
MMLGWSHWGLRQNAEENPTDSHHRGADSLEQASPYAC